MLVNKRISPSILTSTALFCKNLIPLILVLQYVIPFSIARVKESMRFLSSFFSTSFAIFAKQLSPLYLPIKVTSFFIIFCLLISQSPVILLLVIF
ncbi:hypothetical protein JS55_07730 [Rickettsia felis str. LSU]|nr:hypothetical protein JS55_07730 [Rickettsia felis str. LSU]